MKVAKIEPHQLSEKPDVEPTKFQPVSLPEINAGTPSKQHEKNMDPHLSQGRMAALLSLIKHAKKKHGVAEIRHRKKAIAAYKAFEKFEDEHILNIRYKFVA